MKQQDETTVESLVGNSRYKALSLIYISLMVHGTTPRPVWSSTSDESLGQVASTPVKILEAGVIDVRGICGSTQTISFVQIAVFSHIDSMSLKSVSQ